MLTIVDIEKDFCKVKQLKGATASISITAAYRHIYLQAYNTHYISIHAPHAAYSRLQAALERIRQAYIKGHTLHEPTGKGQPITLYNSKIYNKYFKGMGRSVFTANHNK